MTQAHDVTPLARQVMGAHACRKLRGQFLPAPLGENASGTAFVERCAAVPLAQALHLDVGGVLWDGGALEDQHVRLARPLTLQFSASVDLDAHAYYHPPSKLITVHAAPGTEVRAKLDVAGPMEATPRTFAAMLFPRGKTLEGAVRGEIRDTGSAMMQSTIADGASLVVSLRALDRPQFSRGLLDPGQVPVRALQWSEPSWVNEAIHVRGAGVVVRGPFDPAPGARIVARIDEGAFRVVLACDAELAPLVSAVTEAGHVGLESVVSRAIAGKPVATFTSSSSTTLPVPACRWVAIVQPESTLQPTVGRGALLVAEAR